MSEVKVNKISPRSGTEVTLGDSGDTFTIPSGATINNQGTATNFGATGSASWVTTVKTSTFTAVAGEGYFINTTGGVVSVNLPAGVAGAVVAIKDYAGTFDTNAVTLVQNGSDKIGGSTVNATLDTEGIAVTLVFIDSTQGWLVTDSGLQDEAPTAQYITATGGTITTAPCGNFKIHTFTGPGTFTVCSVGNAAGSNSVDYIVVAGGAAGAGKNNGGGVGGGGAGGIRIGTVSQPSPLSPSPLVAPGHSVSVQSYPIVVGGGGACSTTVPNGTAGTSGSNSSFSSFTSAGGGGGNDAGDSGAAGGSGGGGGEACGGAGAGNTPATPIAQGNPGGVGNSPSVGGGGGGFTAAGEASQPPACSTTGDGGAGINAGPIFGSANGSPGGNFGGGGGASTGQPTAGPFVGGTGGGGNGNAHDQASQSGGTNTGGGGGGHGSTGAPQGGSNAGGSGIVIIRYKFQQLNDN